MAGLWKISWVRRQRLRFWRPLQILASPVFARYITFVIKTSTVIADPPATSRYRVINSWSRMTINLPFSKLGIVMGDPIFVP